MKRRALALFAIVATATAVIPLGAPQVSSAKGMQVGRVHADYQPEDGKLFILVIGSDARYGNTDVNNADAIHIVGINTKTMKGGILNFPRDSWVSIPGYRMGRINEALLAGGPELLAQTVENLTGIRLDYWVMTGFQGFMGLVDDIGGVKMNIPAPIYDPGGSGAKIDAGRQWLGPHSSLAFVRTRKIFTGGDVVRTSNQGRYLLAMLGKLRTQVSANPASLLRWTSSVRRWTRLDVSPEELFRLGILATQVNPKDVANVTIPVRLGMAGAASVVFISPSASSLYVRFRESGSL